MNIKEIIISLNHSLRQKIKSETIRNAITIAFIFLVILLLYGLHSDDENLALWSLVVAAIMLILLSLHATFEGVILQEITLQKMIGFTLKKYRYRNKSAVIIGIFYLIVSVLLITFLLLILGQLAKNS